MASILLIFKTYRFIVKNDGGVKAERSVSQPCGRYPVPSDDGGIVLDLGPVVGGRELVERLLNQVIIPVRNWSGSWGGVVYST